MATDTWGPRDFPVLDAAVDLFDRAHGGVRLNEIAIQTGFDEATVGAAVDALESDGLVETAAGSLLGTDRVTRITGEGRRRAGAWPSPEAAYDNLLAQLAHQIETQPEGAERTKLVQFRDGTLGLGRDVAVRVLANILTGGVTP